MNDERLSRAVTTYLGYGSVSHPGEGLHSVARLLKEDGGSLDDCLPLIEEILKQLKALRPDWTSYTLASAGQWAKEEMRAKYPMLDKEALGALEWAFTWWWK
jgi:hypothetical protein